MEFCYPCPPTFLLPISPAAHFEITSTRGLVPNDLESKDAEFNFPARRMGWKGSALSVKPFNTFIDTPRHPFGKAGGDDFWEKDGLYVERITLHVIEHDKAINPTNGLTKFVDKGKRKIARRRIGIVCEIHSINTVRALGAPEIIEKRSRTCFFTVRGERSRARGRRH